MKMKRLEALSINRNPTPWEKNKRKSVKIATLNWAGLKSHFKDIQMDEKIKKADIIHLIETSLTETELNPLTLPGYEVHDICIGNGKGISTYYKRSMFKNEKDYVTENMQVTKFSSEKLNIISVYRSSRGSKSELAHQIEDMLDQGKATLINRDFNICIMDNSNNKFSIGLRTKGHEQLTREPTHIMGGHIDHVYLRDTNNMYESPIIER